jgi:hypothetical protein
MKQAAISYSVPIWHEKKTIPSQNPESCCRIRIHITADGTVNNTDNQEQQAAGSRMQEIVNDCVSYTQEVKVAALPSKFLRGSIGL